MPTVGNPVPGYYYDQSTDTLRPIAGGPGPKGDPGNANVTVSPNAPAVAGKAGDLWVQTTTTPWVAPPALPRGWMGYAEVTASQSGIGATVTDLAGLSITFTAVASRRYKVTWSGGMTQATAAAICAVSLYDGSGTRLASCDQNMAANTYTQFGGCVVKTFTAGSVTVKVRASTNAGSCATNVAPNAPMMLLVEDIGT